MTKWKIIGIVFSLGLLLMGVTIWRVDKFTFRDRTDLIESQLSGLTAAGAVALSAEANSLYGKFIPNEILSGKSDRVDWTAFYPFEAFFFTQNDSKGNRQLKIFLKDKMASQTLNALSIDKAIGILPSTSKTEIIFRALSDSNREKHVIYLLPNSDRWFGFISTGDSIQSFIEKQKGRQIQMSVINTEGVTIGHSIRDYVGSRSSDNPILAEILKNNPKQGHGVFTLGQNSKVLANYEKIPGVGGYIVTSTPQSEINGNRKVFLAQTLLLFLGFLFICMASIYGFWIPIEKTLQTIQNKAKYLAGGNKIKYQGKDTVLIPEAEEIIQCLNQIENQRILQRKTPSVSTLPSQNMDNNGFGVIPLSENNDFLSSGKFGGTSGEQLQKEKLQVYQKVASAMGHEFRGPLTSILGYSQSILARSKDPYITQTADSILLQIRNTRNMLDKLFLFSGDNLHSKKKALLETPLQMAVKSLESTLVRKGVRIIKNFENKTLMPISSVDLQRAFECILTNSMEAMERMVKKEISIKSTFDGKRHVIVISDTGEGIESQHLDRIFDPFFTTRSFSNHMGLGLSVALGIIKEHGGNMVIESNSGKGTVVTITFDPSFKEETVNSKSDYKGDQGATEGDAEASSLPKDVPKLKNKESVMIEQFENERMTTKEQPSLEINIDHLLEELPEKQHSIVPKIEFIETPSLRELKPIIPSYNAPLENSESLVAATEHNSTAVAISENEIKVNSAMTDITFIDDLVIPKSEKKGTIESPKPHLKKKSHGNLDKFQVEIKRPERRM